MKKVAVILCTLLCIATLFGCSADDNKGETTDNKLNNIMGGDNSLDTIARTDEDTVPMDADSLVFDEADNAVFDEIKTSISDESGEVYDLVREILVDIKTHDFGKEDCWMDCCYVSDEVISACLVQEGKSSEAYTLLVFSEDFSRCVELSLIYLDGEYSWGVQGFESKILNMLKDNENEKFRFANNGGAIAIDSENRLYVLGNGSKSESDYSMSGDVYSAIGGDTYAVSWSEITAEEHLHKIDIN